MTEPTFVAFDAATSIFNLPDYRVLSVTVLEDGRRQIIVETDQPPGCPSCGVVATRRKERRLQRIRDIPVAGAVEVLWSKYRWHCEERACPRLSFFESTAQVPRRVEPPHGDLGGGPPLGLFSGSGGGGGLGLSGHGGIL